MPSPEQANLKSPEIFSPSPFNVVVIKLNSKCNFGCKGCYMYEHSDQSWRNQPRQMEQKTLEAAAFRVGEHAHAHGLKKILIVLHGGEPTLSELTDPGTFDRVVDIFKKAMPEGTELRFGMQTNGSLVTDQIMEVCERNEIEVGISIDGDRATNNLLRPYPNGKGTYDDIVAGIEALKKHPELYSTLLFRVEPTTAPLEIYHSIRQHGAPANEPLLPHATWDTPPPGYENGEEGTLYADWLIPIFDYWFDNPEEPPIPTFEEIIRLHLGEEPQLDNGIFKSAVVTIETNGDIQGPDIAKVVDGLPDLGMNVFTHSLNEALSHPKTKIRQLGRAALTPECLSCEVVHACGGGSLSHRYKSVPNLDINKPGLSVTETLTPFLNRSPYCKDYIKLIDHIGLRLVEKIRESQLAT